MMAYVVFVASIVVTIVVFLFGLSWYLAVRASDGNRALAISGTFVLSVLVLAATYLSFAGSPTLPQAVGLSRYERLDVLGFHIVEGAAIYLLVDAEGMSWPRYIVLPYSKQAAMQLVAAAKSSKRGEREQIVTMVRRDNGDEDLEGKWVFYPYRHLTIHDKDTEHFEEILP